MPPWIGLFKISQTLLLSGLIHLEYLNLEYLNLEYLNLEYLNFKIFELPIPEKMEMETPMVSDVQTLSCLVDLVY